MIWAQFFKMAVAHLLAVAAPGPDFAMVLKQSLAHGRRTALWTSVGIGSAILVHVTYTLLGIGLLMRESPLAFAVIKYCGAAYLAWIGVKALWPHGSAASAGSAAPVDRGPAAPRAGAAWVRGFLTNVLNPKVTLFIVALFATLIDPRTPKWAQIGYGLWMAGATIAWFSLVSMLFTRERVRRAFLRAGPWIDRGMGVVLLALAAVLALASIS